MKRGFYTLLLATALTLPAAHAMAQAAPAAIHAGAATSASVGVNVTPAVGTVVAPGADANAGLVMNAPPAMAGKTGIALQPDGNAPAPATIGTGPVPVTTGAAANAAVAVPAMPDKTMPAPAPSAAAPASAPTDVTETPGADTASPAPAMPDKTMSNPELATTPAPGAAPVDTKANETAAGEVAAPAADSGKPVAKKKHHKAASAHSKEEVSAATISKIQENLNSAGYLKTPADGKWSPATVAALRKYQADNKLAATGKVDADTMNKLGLMMSAGQAPAMGATAGSGDNVSYEKTGK